MTRSKTEKNNNNKADERGNAGDGDRDHQQHEDSESDLTATLLRLVVKVTEVLTANSNLQSEIKELRDCNITLLQRIETLEDKSGEWVNNSQPVAMSDVSALVSTVADEMQARRDKELNLVIYGIEEPESDSESEDKNSVCEVLTTLQVESPNVTTVFRMGRKTSGRSRLLKVYCGNSETRQSALQRAKKLKDLPPGHKHRRVFVRSDLTQLQRDQDFKKRQETRSRQQGSAQPTNRQRHSAEPSSSHGHRAGNRGLRVALPPPLD